MHAEDPRLSYVKPLAWADVFSLWRDGEAHLPRWIEHYKRGGFSSWGAWREHTVRDLRCDTLEWKLYEIKDAGAVRDLLAGPFRAWSAKYYGGASGIRFGELVANKELRENPIVNEMLENFPKETYLVALDAPQGITIIEGMHRAVALAAAANEGKDLRAKLFLALARFEGELPMLGQPDSPT